MKNGEFIDESHKEVLKEMIFLKSNQRFMFDDKEFAERMHSANENIAKALKGTKPVTTTPPLTK